MPFDRLKRACSGTLRLVMFDLDGTLVDSLPDLHASCTAMLEALHRPPATRDEVSTWVGNGARQLVARALSGSRQVDPTVTQTHIDTALSLFKKHYRHLNGHCSRAYPGARELLVELQAAGIATAIITNKPMEFTQVLCAKLDLPAQHILGGDSLAEMKPSPLPLHTCLRHFQLPPCDAVMVGDSINDLAAAKAAEVAAIAVSYGYNHGLPLPVQDAAGVIDSLEELR